MRDECVQRVLIQLENLRTELGRLEAQTHTQIRELRPFLEPLSVSESSERRQEMHFLLGKIDGLVTAQMTITERGGKYRELSQMAAIRARHQANSPSAPQADQPSGEL